MSGDGFVTADFGTGQVTGTFPQVSWDDGAGGRQLTTDGGLRFGVTLDANVVGDDFFGTLATMPIDNVAMTGEIQGDFYGPTGEAPSEIGGAFYMGGPSQDGVAVGGLQGIFK